MIGSTGRRWKHICIAGAGLACLGAGTIFISGCSTTTVSDTRTPAKADQQVAGTKGTAPGKPATARKAKTTKTAPQVAKKNVPGKVRISDLDGETRVQMAARVSQNKAQADASRNNAAAAPSGASTAAVANKPTQAPARSADQRQVARAPGAANAAQPQRAAAASSTPPAVAAKTRTATGEIKQTSGDGQPRSGSSSRSVTTTSAARPVITPRKSEWQPENGGEAVASNHERRRADRLMQRAYTMYEGGYREEALRLASVAAELPTSTP
jgi:hypothetical protein